MTKLSAYLSLCKFKIVRMVVVTAAIGFYLKNEAIHDWTLFLNTLLGTGLVCAGVCAFNHVLEWRYDSKMSRTKNRPLPSGLLSLAEASSFASLLTLLGALLLMLAVSWFLMLGALVTGALYLFFYTPLKRFSWLNTSVGAIPGALPPMGGWVAAGGGFFDLEAWLLFFILFFWQHPHFYAIAWLCRKDYAKAGYRMITEKDEDGRRTFQHSLIHALLLLIVTVTLKEVHSSLELVYLLGAWGAGLWFFYETFKAYESRTNQAAKRVIISSVIYFPILLLFIFLDLWVL